MTLSTMRRSDRRAESTPRNWAGFQSFPLTEQARRCEQLE
jgi:hypothetical protein